MLIRFHKVEYDVESHCFDYDNSKIICGQYRDDYVEFIKMLYLFKEDGERVEPSRNFGNVSLYEYNQKTGEKEEHTYDIIDVQLSLPIDSDANLTCIEVYLYEDF